MGQSPSFRDLTKDRIAHLRILATTDLHVHVRSYDYFADRPSRTLGLARTATLIAAARAEAANSLLVDNGDLLQGSPMGDYVALNGLGEQVHPIFSAMNALGFDAATLGNHDFNYGLDFLLDALRGAAFPFVSANVALELGAEPRQDRTLLKPYVVLDRSITDGAGQSFPMRIGIIGFAPPQIVLWDRALLEGRVWTRDIVESAAGWLPEMKEAGCDVIVALAHSGIGAAIATPGMEDASVPLAALPGIDAVVTGHSHLVFPSPAFPTLPGVDPVRGTLAGKPAVMAGFWGSHLGVIDLLVQRDMEGWHVIASQSEARPISVRGGNGRVHRLVPSAPVVLRQSKGDHAATLDFVRRPIGHTIAPMDSHFALCTPSACVALVAEAQARHVAQALQGSEWAGLPILSAAAPVKTGGRGGPGNFTRIPAGDLALRHAADLYAYPNVIAALKLTGTEIVEWLERAAAVFCQLTPGQTDQPLIDPGFPSYNFDVLHALDITFDLQSPARYDVHGHLANASARRVCDVLWNGAPVAPGDSFVVATNNYRAWGTGNFATSPPIWTGRDRIRDILLRHIAAESPLRPDTAAFWRFRPMPGTAATFVSAPDAEPPPDLPLSPLGLTDEGFARFRLHL